MFFCPAIIKIFFVASLRECSCPNILNIPKWIIICLIVHWVTSIERKLLNLTIKCKELFLLTKEELGNMFACILGSNFASFICPLYNYNLLFDITYLSSLLQLIQIEDFETPMTRFLLLLFSLVQRVKRVDLYTLYILN